MTRRHSRDRPSTPVRPDPEDDWKLVDDPAQEPLRGGMRDTSRILAVVTTVIAILAVAAALTVLVLPI